MSNNNALLSQIGRMNARQLHAAVTHKQLSAVEVTQAILERMHLLNPSLHAFCTPTPEVALAQAQAVDDKVGRGQSVGPLAGIPISVKDLIATAGIRTMFGSFAYQNFVPEEDDVVVERIVQADAVIIGKTTASELGYSAVGHNPVSDTARNPWDINRTPGGSSAGSAAAVAAGLGPLTLGSDGGGSVRIPAAFCGLVGVKASMGRVPVYPGCRDERYPGISSWESLEHIGPLARNLPDAALLLSVIAGPDRRDRHSIPTCDIDWTGALTQTIAGTRIVFSPNWGYLPVDPQISAMVKRAVTVFEKDLGCHVVESHPGWTDQIFDEFSALIALDTDLVGMRRLMADYQSTVSPTLKAFLDHAWTAEQFTNALTYRKYVVNTMWRFMKPYDLLITPTVATQPFAINTEGPAMPQGEVHPTFWQGFTFPINLTGQPAISIPIGFTREGLPVGMQIVGHHLDDWRILAAGHAFEQVRGPSLDFPQWIGALGL